MISLKNNLPSLITGLVCAAVVTIINPVSAGPDNGGDPSEFFASLAPPLKKGGTGGFSPAATAQLGQRKSPSAPLFQRGKLTQAQPLCIEVTNDQDFHRKIPMRVGSILQVSFRHSIYASQVEEVFLIRANGFELNQLRYSEARLVDFYGHEAATRDNGAWIVTPAPAFLPELKLNLSADAAMSLGVEGETFNLPPDRAYRITVGPCNDHRYE